MAASARKRVGCPHKRLRDLLGIASSQATNGRLAYGRYSDAFQFALGTSPAADPRRGIGDATDAAQGCTFAGVI